jgi:hypothetical protein
MDQINTLLEQIKNSDNPMVYYIVGAILVLVAAIVLRSLIATLITISAVGILILIVLYATGHPLPKINLDKVKLPDLAKFLPSNSPTEPTETPEPKANKPIDSSLIPKDINPFSSGDSLKDEILQDRRDRNMRRSLGF